MNKEDFNASEEQNLIFNEENDNLKSNMTKLNIEMDYLSQEIQKSNEIMKDNRGDYKTLDDFDRAKREKNKKVDKLNIIKEQIDSPYFGHIVVTVDDETIDIFIGERNIRDENHDIIVYDSDDPVCGLFYSTQTQYIHKSPGGEKVYFDLNLKRDIDIENKKLVHVEEKYNKSNKKTNAINDYFLNKVLKEKKNQSHFSSIVKSIQANQNDIIREDYNTSILCQGVAGSGKTVIIGHKIRYVLYNNDDLNPNVFLYLAPNGKFKEEVKILFNSLKLERLDNINLLTYDEYLINKFKKVYNYESNTKNNLTDIIILNSGNNRSYSDKDIDSIYQFINKNYINKYKNYIDKYNYTIDENISGYENLKELNNNINNKISEIDIVKRNVDKYVENIEEIISNIMNAELVNSIGKPGYNFNNMKDINTNFYARNEMEIGKNNQEIEFRKELLQDIEKQLNEKYGRSLRRITEETNTIKESLDQVNNDIENIESNISKELNNDIFKKYDSLTIDDLRIKINDIVKKSKKEIQSSIDRICKYMDVDKKLYSIDNIDSFYKTVFTNVHNIKKDSDNLLKKSNNIFNRLFTNNSEDIYKQIEDNNKLLKKISEEEKELIVKVDNYKELQKELNKVDKIENKLNKNYFLLKNKKEEKELLEESYNSNKEVMELIEKQKESKAIIKKCEEYIDILRGVSTFKEILSVVFSLYDSSNRKDTERVTFDNVYKFNIACTNIINWLGGHYPDVDKKIRDGLNKIVVISRKINEIIDKIDYKEYYQYKNDVSSLLRFKNVETVIKEIMARMNITINNLNRNSLVVILTVINKMGFVNEKEYSYIYIDEAQDYNDTEINLLNKIEGYPVLNIFGDLKQNIINVENQRESWDSLINKLDIKFKRYYLKENYRNTTNVVNYCNKLLKTEMVSLGLKGNEIIEYNYKNKDEILSMAKEHEAIIITNNNDLLQYFISKNIECYSLIEIKGLEKKNAIVIDENFNNNEKYVAYTRSLNDLIIVHHPYDKPKYLDDLEKIKKEILKDDMLNYSIEKVKKAPSKVLINGKVTYPKKKEILESVDRIIDKDNTVYQCKIQKFINDTKIEGELEQYFLVELSKRKVKMITDDELLKINNINVDSNNSENSKLIIKTPEKTSIPKVVIKETKRIEKHEYTYDEIYKLLMSLIGYKKEIKMSKFISLVSQCTSDKELQDRIYEELINKGIKIIEEE